MLGTGDPSLLDDDDLGQEPTLAVAPGDNPAAQDALEGAAVPEPIGPPATAAHDGPADLRPVSTEALGEPIAAAPPTSGGLSPHAPSEAMHAGAAGWGAPQPPQWTHGGGAAFAPPAGAPFGGAPTHHAQGAAPYPQPMGFHHPQAPLPGAGKAPFAPRASVLLVIIGVCLAIFVTGVALFVTTNF